MNQETNLPQAVRQFMTTGGMSTAGFNADQATLYMGLQLEEMAEKVEAVATGSISMQDKARLLTEADRLRVLSLEFKQGKHRGDVMRADREKLLDADIDLAWVSLGAAYSTSTNTSGAVAEVARANLDKFPGGIVLRDENGKIKKPNGWVAPDLSQFVEIEAPLKD